MYTFVDKISPELVRVQGPEGVQVWTITNMRKNCNCAVFGTPIRDTRAWRPVTNKKNRGERISCEAMKHLKEKALEEWNARVQA